MCGRYVSTRDAQQLAFDFDAVLDADFDTTPGTLLALDYNVAPMKNVYLIRQASESHKRIVSTARWGLVPSWAKTPAFGARTINARAETVADKPAFRSAFAHRRCLVPADGWYEWTPNFDGAAKQRKQPFFISPSDSSNPGLAFAGLWETWNSDSQRLRTCTILTTSAVGQLSDIHERMPLLLGREDWTQWLEADDESPRELLAPPSPTLVEKLSFHPVDPSVGNVRNNGPHLIAPLMHMNGA